MKRLALEPEHAAGQEEWGGEPEAEGLSGGCRSSLSDRTSLGLGGTQRGTRPWEGIRHPDRQASYKNSNMATTRLA